MYRVIIHTLTLICCCICLQFGNTSLYAINLESSPSVNDATISESIIECDVLKSANIETSISSDGRCGPKKCIETVFCPGDSIYTLNDSGNCECNPICSIKCASGYHVDLNACGCVPDEPKPKTCGTIISFDPLDPNSSTTFATATPLPFLQDVCVAKDGGSYELTSKPRDFNIESCNLESVYAAPESNADKLLRAALCPAQCPICEKCNNGPLEEENAELQKALTAAQGALSAANEEITRLTSAPVDPNEPEKGAKPPPSVCPGPAPYPVPPQCRQRKATKNRTRTARLQAKNGKNKKKKSGKPGWCKYFAAK